MSTNGRASVRPPSRRPLYARVLGLRYVRPSALMSFLLCECAIALAALLALAELVSWWAVAVLPLSIAAMVKLNDLVTGAMRRSARPVAARPKLADESWDPVPAWDAPRATAQAPRLTRVVQRERSIDERDTTSQHNHRFGDSAARRYHRPRDSAARRAGTSRHAASTNERRFGRSA